MKQKELTPKQERFCELYANGKTGSDAYRGAYDAEKMTVASVNSAACELLKNPNISVRVKELKQAASRMAEWDIFESFKHRKTALDLAYDAGDYKAMTPIIDGIDGLLGIEPAKKVDLTITSGKLQKLSDLYSKPKAVNTDDALGEP